jgi:two-component system response regulator RpaA
MPALPGVTGILKPSEAKVAVIMLAGLSYDLEVAISRALTAARYDVTTARDAAAALAAVELSPPAVMLLNPDLPSPDGLSLCGEIRALPAARKTMIVLVTNQDTLPAKLNGFAAGADDYITVPFVMPELLLRIEALLRRAARLNAHDGAVRLGAYDEAGRRQPAPDSGRTRRHGPLALDGQTGDLWLFGRHIALTPVETRLLDYLMTCAGRPASAEELLRRVWKQAPGVGDPALVRVHVQHLREKLEADPLAPRLLKTMPRFGYCLAAEGAL